MRPLTVITGILLGSAVAITLSLTAVLIVFLILGDEHSRVAAEVMPLTHSILIFLGMTILTAASFYALLVGHQARYLALALMFSGLAATTCYYLP